MLIGYIWYSPKLFGKKWMKLSNISYRNIKLFGKVQIRHIYIYFLISFFIAYVLSVFLDYLGSTTISDGAQVSLWIWLGFIFTNSISDYIFPKKIKSLEMFFIDNGYVLTGLLVMGMILAVWR
jgi:hypothetical protein